MAFFSAISLLLENNQFYNWIVVLKFSNAGIAFILYHHFSFQTIVYPFFRLILLGDEGDACLVHEFFNRL